MTGRELRQAFRRACSLWPGEGFDLRTVRPRDIQLDDGRILRILPSGACRLIYPTIPRQQTREEPCPKSQN